MPDHNGLLPLHVASKGTSRQNKKSVDILLEAYPDAVRHRDTIDGSLPLHYALLESNTTGSMLDAVQALVGAFPDSVRTTNNIGWLPMHSGCSAIGIFNDVAPPEFMHFLTELFPQELLVPSRDGRMPFQLARSKIFDERYRVIRSFLETKQDEVTELLRSSIDEIGKFKSLPEDFVRKHIWGFAKPYFGDEDEAMEQGD
jgi:hypothetical protein